MGFSGQDQILEMIATGAPLDACLSELVRLVEANDPGMLCSILLLDPDGVHLRHGAAPSLPVDYARAIDGEAIGPSAGSCGTAAFRRAPVIVEDIAADPLWAGYRELALSHGLRACWSTPIFDMSKRLLGTFAMYYREPGRPFEEHLRWIEIATHLAAIAIGLDRSQALLRVGESRYRRLVESNIVGVVIANLDGSIGETNEAFREMLGYTRGDFEAGRVRWDTITPSEWRAQDRSVFDELKREGVSPPFEKEYIHRDGHRVPIRVTVALLDGTSGDCICLIEDLTERRQAEASLRESEERFSNAFHTSPAAITITRIADGRFVDVNSAFLRMFEFTREDVIGHTSLELKMVTADARRELIRTQLESGGLQDSELLVHTKSGRPIHLQFSSKPMQLAGEPHHVTTLIDITERWQAIEALRESEERLRLSTELANVAVWEYDFCANSMSRSANHDHLYGLEWQSKWDINTFLDATHPDDRERSNRVIEQSVAAGGDDQYEVDFRVVHPDQSIHWLVAIGQVVERDGEGRGRLVRGCLIDITERKRVEASLRESLERLDRAQRVGRVGFLDWDLETNRLYLSDEVYRLFGLERGGAFVTPEFVVRTVHPDDLLRVQESLELAVAGSKPYDILHRILRPDGSVVWVHAMAEISRDEEGAPKTLLGTVVDVTELKRTGEDLQQVNERLRNLSSRLLEIQETERRQIARELHDEIGQALTATRISLQSLERHPEPSTMSGRLAELVDVVDRALGQVRSLSLLLRPPLLDDLGLAPALRWLTDQHARRAGLLVEFRGGEVDTRYDPAVETACFRVAQEALNNIARHAGARHVAVELQTQADALHLRVLDDGTGFDVPAASRRAAQGASLGLLSMKERATLAGGGIEWRSIPGEGTEVHAWFAHRPLSTASDESRLPS